MHLRRIRSREHPDLVYAGDSEAPVLTFYQQARRLLYYSKRVTHLGS